jgi:hypothetical protein
MAGDVGRERMVSIIDRKVMRRNPQLPVWGFAAVIGVSLCWKGWAWAQLGTLSIEATKHMVKECRQQHENVADTIDELLAEMETAQRSHDIARMRAVLELSQMKLADLKQEMALCTNLMNMIDRRTTEHETSQHDMGKEDVSK